MKTAAFFLSMLLTISGVVLGQRKPTTAYAPVNGPKVYYEIHGSGEPVVILHGALVAAYQARALHLRHPALPHSK